MRPFPRIRKIGKLGCAGNVSISAGQNCAFVGGSISGNMQQHGGMLFLSGATIAGNLQIDGVSAFSIAPAATIQGDLQVQKIPAGTAVNQVCTVSLRIRRTRAAGRRIAIARGLYWLSRRDTLLRAFIRVLLLRKVSRLWRALPCSGLALIATFIAFGLGQSIHARSKPINVKQQIAKLKDKRSEVRALAVALLRESKDPRAVDPLINELKDTAVELRFSAAIAWGDFGDSRAVEPLISAMNDPDVNVRQAATLSLLRINRSPHVIESIRNALQSDADYQLLGAPKQEPTSKYIISEFKPGCQGSTNTFATIQTAPQATLLAGGNVVDVLPDDASTSSSAQSSSSPPSIQSMTWCPGARHIILGKLQIAGYKLVSDWFAPLIFRVDRNGYVYERGRGIVITSSNERILLQSAPSANQPKGTP